MMRHNAHKQLGHPLGILASSRWVSSGNAGRALKAVVGLWRALRGRGGFSQSHVWPLRPGGKRF
jgi:hypothetical protein